MATTTTHKQTNSRNIGLDILRVASVLYIAGFYHALNYAQAIPKYGIITGRLAAIMLGVYVLISGYLIGSKDISLDKQSLMLFYKKRLIRIYPLYLVAIVLFQILHLSSSMKSIKAACMVSMLIKPGPPTLWFVTMIMLFYLISPLIIAECRNGRIRRLALCCLFSVVCMMIYAYFTKLLDVRIILYFPVFVLGVFTANNGTDSSPRNHIMFPLLAISFLASFLKIPSEEFSFLTLIPMVIFWPCVLFRVSERLSISSGRVYKVIVALSYSSYCMYLFHRPLYMLLTEFCLPLTPGLQILCLAMVYLPCIILCSFLLQKTYDVLASILLNKVSTRKKYLHR